MSTAPTTTAQPPAVLHNIDWPTYSRLLRVLQRSRRFRLTYDRGVLEIMPPMFAHEGPTHLLRRIVDVLTEELQLPVRGGGSVTLRRRRRRRGLEPDSCYWIAHANRLLGKTNLDLRTDPPPDLAIEVDVTNSSLNRMSIYAALGVPEVWRLSSEEFSFNILEKGQYHVQPTSLSFARLASADLIPFLSLQGQTDDNSVVRQFREWVRQNLLGGQPAP